MSNSNLNLIMTGVSLMGGGLLSAQAQADFIKDSKADLELKNYYFNPKRYDLAKVGRYKINKKLGLLEAFDHQTLTIADVVAAIRYIVALHDGREQTETPQGTLDIGADDIDHFGNRRMRTVGELIQNQLRTGLARM
eukprot:gene8383-8204_t